MKYFLVFVLCNFIWVGNAVSDTIYTDIDGFIIKDLQCSVTGFTYLGVNRSKTSSVNAKVTIKVLDRDGDPVGFCGNDVRLGTVSGNKFHTFGACNCDLLGSTIIKVEEKNY